MTNVTQPLDELCSLADTQKEREAFEASNFDFPSVSASWLSSIGGTIDPSLQDYFWECGFAGWLAARRCQK